MLATPSTLKSRFINATWEHCQNFEEAEKCTVIIFDEINELLLIVIAMPTKWRKVP